MTLALALTGGIAATLLHLPLALLLGSMVAVGAVAMAGWKPMGHEVGLPGLFRLIAIPVIGIAIGGSFTPDILRQATQWAPSLLALSLFVPLAHILAFGIYRAGGVDPVSAYWGTVPGGLIESVTLGEEAGADPGMLVLMQFLRLILTIVAVPLLFVILTGEMVGSGAGVALQGSDKALRLADIAILAVAGFAGFHLGHLLRLPAAVMTGPLIASAVVHLTGLTEGVPPGWAIAATQVVVGAGLGARFTGMSGSVLRRGFVLAMIATMVLLAVAWAFAVLLAPWVGQPVAALFLAFAPGGITEMSLIALSLQISVVFVTLHHIVRIVLSIAIARALAGRFGGLHR
ncbi:AbrB family transcriptional regulator [Szabonella alba]|uniref:AbrB family transcriptional regulator n=1 Tax=Szabonella alba TaxID=2804194 RepID=A0A8K0V6A4_9RHOB|nr:AbrB family transcriptional regulator [Szabonella alba]